MSQPSVVRLHLVEQGQPRRTASLDLPADALSGRPLHIHLHVGPQNHAPVAAAVPPFDSPLGRPRRPVRSVLLLAGAIIAGLGLYEIGANVGQGRARSEAQLLGSPASSVGGLASLARPTATFNPPLAPDDIAAAVRRQLAQPATVSPPPRPPAASSPASPFGLQP